MHAHFHRHDDVVLCDGGHGWPDYVGALFATLFHIQGELMTQQDQINADVSLLADALTGIGKELQDYQASLAQQAPQLDLSGLDAIAQKALNLAPPTSSAPSTDTPAPAPVDQSGPTGTAPPLDPAPDAAAPSDPAAVNPAPTL